MKVEIAPLESLPQDSGVRVKVGELRIAMFRVGERVYALADRCSHAEAWLSEGEIWDGAVECPRHGSEFDLETGVPMSLPATKPVPTYEVAVEDGTVFLMLEDA
jgi:3-phenylpropionate/trans-cinnamate dioxygenase ferredoxin component